MHRKLAGDYKFTPCPNERPCNTIIATYTKEQVKSILETILIKLINVDGCLDEYSELYGSCKVPSNCICPTFINELIDLSFWIDMFATYMSKELLRICL